MPPEAEDGGASSPTDSTPSNPGDPLPEGKIRSRWATWRDRGSELATPSCAISKDQIADMLTKGPTAQVKGELGKVRRPQQASHDGVRLEFDDQGTIRTVVAKYRPLSMKHLTQMPIVAEGFGINSYGEQELGMKPGWKLVRIAGSKVRDDVGYGSVIGELVDRMKCLPQWPLPIEFCESLDAEIGTVVNFYERPLGLNLSETIPVRVLGLNGPCAAQRQGVKQGWYVRRVGGRDVRECGDFSAFYAVLKNCLDDLDNSGR
uniref:PDZ domain-containing protein n=1 Tax=Alexandrium monilatum TaxID=311494 RepID=A0A7S4QW95_9DINO|mmetsp:Transcript_23911/g.71427  ORF Transcript_23911/g.71427 Transcript_23911/m.71427 type:complete len:261 (-) Transcript_23911:93-875(-)